MTCEYGKLYEMDSLKGVLHLPELINLCRDSLEFIMCLIMWCSKRKNFKQHQKQVAIQRAGRKLGTRMNPGSPVSQGNRTGTGN